MKSLKWHQVHAWRLSQHSLSPRLKQQDFVKAVTRTGGIQAQVMSAAELALFTRVEELSPQDVKSALWQDRTLVKTWAMRGTLHILAASDLPLYIAARSWHETRNWSNYFAYYGITPAQQEAFLSAVPHVLGNEPVTRQRLAAAIARHTGVPQLRDLILSSGWGSPLKPSDTLHLLPLFDAYTIGMPRDLEPLLSKAYKNHVFRPQGWISAVVLVNGSIQGVWQYKTRGPQTVVKVYLFSSPTALIRKGIEAECASVGAWACPARLSWPRAGQAPTEITPKDGEPSSDSVAILPLFLYN